MTPAGRVADNPGRLSPTTTEWTEGGLTVDPTRAQLPGKVVPPDTPAFAALSGWLPVTDDSPDGDELARSDVGVAAEAARVALDAGLARLRALLPQTGQEMDGNGRGTAGPGTAGDGQPGMDAGQAQR